MVEVAAGWRVLYTSARTGVRRAAAGETSRMRFGRMGGVNPADVIGACRAIDQIRGEARTMRTARSEQNGA